MLGQVDDDLKRAYLSGEDVRRSPTGETVAEVGERAGTALDEIGLAAPDGSWIRLQTAIVYDKNDAPAMELVGRRVGEDILAFVRTLTLEQIQGASGLEALRDDLNERAQLRSDGKVRELLIEMLVVR